MRSLIIALLIVFIADSTFGACGLCGKRSGVVCRNQTSFSFCQNDNDVNVEVYNCPAGTTCGDDIRICAKSPENPCNPVCGNCTSRFVCLSEETYALCFGQGYPSGSTYICPEGYRCSSQRDALEPCYRKESIRNEEIDCYKGIIVNPDETNGAIVLLPPIIPFS